jgi:hypothetical protein
VREGRYVIKIRAMERFAPKGQPRTASIFATPVSFSMTGLPVLVALFRPENNNPHIV